MFDNGNAQNLSSMSLPITELDLSPRSVKALKTQGINYVAQILQRTEPELRKLPNIGARLFNEIKKVIEYKGFTLGQLSDVNEKFETKEEIKNYLVFEGPEKSFQKDIDVQLNYPVAYEGKLTNEFISSCLDNELSQRLQKAFESAVEANLRMPPKPASFVAETTSALTISYEVPKKYEGVLTPKFMRQSAAIVDNDAQEIFERRIADKVKALFDLKS